MTDVMLIKLPFLSNCSLQRGLSQAAFNLLLVAFITFFIDYKLHRQRRRNKKPRWEINWGARPCPLQEHL